MKQRTTAAYLSVGMIILAILIIVLILPYLFIWSGFQKESREDEVSCFKTAYNVSVLKFQKVHVIDLILQDCFFMKEFDTALEYVKKLEKITEPNEPQNFYIAEVYYEKGDYENALKYAKESGDDWLIAKSYIGLKQYDEAGKYIDKMISIAPEKPQNNFRKAQLEVAKGDYKEAEIYINKTLPMMKNSRQVWILKAEIAHNLGKLQEEQNCKNKLKEIEAIRNYNIKNKG